MKKLKLKLNDIIKIGSSPLSQSAQVVRIYSDEDNKFRLCGDIEVVYYQNGLKGIKEDMVWIGDRWEFRDSMGGIQIDINRYPDLKK